MAANTPVLVLLAALVIGGMVRLIKSEKADGLLLAMGLPAIPKRWLPIISVGLGMALGIVQGVMTGMSWTAAANSVVSGFLAGLSAVGGHEAGVESIRGGRELGSRSTAVSTGAGEGATADSTGSAGATDTSGPIGGTATAQGDAAG